MESAPLTLAYDHARAASVATQSSETTVAINEHTLAAGEFARAATETGSAEALRTLRLLEQHHQRLSELLRYPSENPPTTSATETEVQAATEKPVSTSAAVAELRASKSDLGPRSSSPLRAPPSLAQSKRPPRDLSSSIASNLASARGIRTIHSRLPLSPSISTQQAPGSLESLPRKDKQTKVSSIPENGQPSWIPPPIVKNERSSGNRIATPLNPPPTVTDEGFSRFYNTFENFLSKISAPLAFAGLPLVSEDTTSQSKAEPVIPTIKRPASRDKSEDPDLTKYISRAALRASARGHSGNDSFYVVPTSGQTISYAQIMSFDQKEKRRMAASIHGENPDLFSDPTEDDDFVDARETPMPSSPGLSRKSSKQMSARDVENKIEELDTENKSLKDCIDRLTKRLHSFELAAQQNNMALQESMRVMRDMSPARDQLFRSVAGGSGGSGGLIGEEGLKRAILELEDRVNISGVNADRLSKENGKLARENEKLKTVLAKYRERWETLKEGAKSRRSQGENVEAGKDGSGKEGQGKKDADPSSGRSVAG